MPDLADIDRYIASAFASFRGARGCAERYPSGRNLEVMDQEEARLNYYLDKRCERMTRAELDAAYRRPMRKLVSA
jgi:propanediol dehydratase large subunit